MGWDGREGDNRKSGGWSDDYKKKKNREAGAGTQMFQDGVGDTARHNARHKDTCQLQLASNISTFTEHAVHNRLRTDTV